MYTVTALDNHGRTKVLNEWLSSSLAVDSIRVAAKQIGHAYRDLFITDGNDDIVFIASSDLACEDALARS